MQTTEKIKNVFHLDDMFEVWCFIYDNQMISGGGIMKGFKGFLHFDDNDFTISDGWDILAEVSIVREKKEFEFYSVPFGDALIEAVEKFIDLCYIGGEIGPNPVKK